jgi:hypothetical protein
MCHEKAFMKNLKYLILFCVISVISINSVFAQEGEMDDLVAGTKSDLLVVVGGGLAGAILGLSTLSFVEEPKKHTRNIIVGASLGIIIGVGYVAMSQATKHQENIYGSPEDEQASLKDDHKSFNTYSRFDWHDEEVANNSVASNQISQIGYQFKF